MKKGLSVIFTVCFLLSICGPGCKKRSAGHSFSHSFDSDQDDAVTLASKMYNSLSTELESRGYTKRRDEVNPEMIYIQYAGIHDSFPLTVDVTQRLVVSEKDPEFTYRVSFEQTGAVAELRQAAEKLRNLMKLWCQHDQ